MTVAASGYGTIAFMTRTCTKCGEAKPVSAFYARKTNGDGIHTICKDCLSASNRAYFMQNRDEITARSRARRAARTEDEHERDKTASREWHAANRETALAYQRAYRLKVKLSVLRHYGPGCACCGELDSRLLSIEHANSDGADHRRALFGRRAAGGASFYQKLAKLGLPDNLGLIVLCLACNHAAFGNKGRCPHEAPDAKFLTDAAALPDRISWLETQLASARALAAGA
jgi:hypothetical protein